MNDSRSTRSGSSNPLAGSQGKFQAPKPHGKPSPPEHEESKDMKAILKLLDNNFKLMTQMSSKIDTMDLKMDNINLRIANLEAGMNITDKRNLGPRSMK